MDGKQENEPDKDSIDIFLFSNGQQYTPPRKHHLKANQLEWWENTLNFLARSHYGSMHTSIEVYTIDGRRIQKPEDLRNFSAYVAVVPSDAFIHAGYEKYLIKASRSWEKRQMRRNSGEVTNPDENVTQNVTSVSESHEKAAETVSNIKSWEKRQMRRNSGEVTNPDENVTQNVTSVSESHEKSAETLVSKVENDRSQNSAIPRNLYNCRKTSKPLEKPKPVTNQINQRRVSPRKINSIDIPTELNAKKAMLNRRYSPRGSSKVKRSSIPTKIRELEHNERTEPTYELSKQYATIKHKIDDQIKPSAISKIINSPAVPIPRPFNKRVPLKRKGINVPVVSPAQPITTPVAPIPHSTVTPVSPNSKRVYVPNKSTPKPIDTTAASTKSIEPPLTSTPGAVNTSPAVIPMPTDTPIALPLNPIDRLVTTIPHTIDISVPSLPKPINTPVTLTPQPTDATKASTQKAIDTSLISTPEHIDTQPITPKLTDIPMALTPKHVDRLFTSTPPSKDTSMAPTPQPIASPTTSKPQSIDTAFTPRLIITKLASLPQTIESSTASKSQPFLIPIVSNELTLTPESLDTQLASIPQTVDTPGTSTPEPFFIPIVSTIEYEMNETKTLSHEEKPMSYSNFTRFEESAKNTGTQYTMINKASYPSPNSVVYSIKSSPETGAINKFSSTLPTIISTATTHGKQYDKSQETEDDQIVINSGIEEKDTLHVANVVYKNPESEVLSSFGNISKNYDSYDSSRSGVNKIEINFTPGDNPMTKNQMLSDNLSKEATDMNETLKENEDGESKIPLSITYPSSSLDDNTVSVNLKTKNKQNQFITLINKGDVVNLRLNIEVSNVEGILKTKQKIHPRKSRSFTEFQTNGGKGNNERLTGSKSLQSFVNGCPPHPCCRKENGNQKVVQCPCCNACPRENVNQTVDNRTMCSDMQPYYILMPVARGNINCCGRYICCPTSEKQVQNSESLMCNNNTSRKISIISQIEKKEEEKTDSVPVMAGDTRLSTIMTFTNVPSQTSSKWKCYPLHDCLQLTDRSGQSNFMSISTSYKQSDGHCSSRCPFNNKGIVRRQISRCTSVKIDNKDVNDKSTQTDWCDVLLEARALPNGLFSFHLPPLQTLQNFGLMN